MDFSTIAEKLELKKSEIKQLEGSSFTKPVFSLQQSALSIGISLNKEIPINLLLKIEKKFGVVLEAKKVNITIDISSNDNKYLDEYSTYYLKNIHQKLTESPLVVINNKQLTIKVKNDDNLSKINKIGLEEFLKRNGYNITVNVEKLNGDIEYIKDIAIQQAPTEVYDKKVDIKQRTITRNTITDFSNINEPMFKVVAEGKAFFIDVFERNNLNNVTISIFNNTGALTTKFSATNNNKKIDYQNIKVSDYLRVEGRIEFDNFAREYVLRADKITKIPDYTNREDEELVKRVELHAHTNKSEMDGISSAEDLITLAYKFKHPAIAITDHQGVQAFPEAQRTAKKLNSKGDHKIKVIYGCEFNMVSNDVKIVYNADENQQISNKFVLFDLETTGLSNTYDEIIEFGAVKMIDGLIVDRLQLFVNPLRRIKPIITNLTGIKQSDVEDALPLKDVIDKIINFIDDCVLVAHNATFDMGFIESALIKHNRKPLNNPYIDTLNFSRVLHHDKKLHALGNVARYYGITYDKDSAHRADYDAELLTIILTSMLKEAEEKSCKTYGDINNLVTDQIFKKVFNRHIVALVKNEEGLKDLFKLVSLSHTKYLVSGIKEGAESGATSALILREEIRKHRSNLLLGSACLNGEVFEIARNRSQKELEEVIQFYDYIEVQPLDNYLFLIDKGQIDSVDILIKILKNIVSTAKKLGKMVVATGDAHYAEPYQKTFRDVYVQVQGVGGVHHPLYSYSGNNASIDQHFRTTKEMIDGFSFLEDPNLVNELVVTNSNLIADMIEEVNPVRKDLYTPKIEGANDKLINLCYETARSKYGNPIPTIVEERLKRELDSILGNDFGVIYYISHLLVKESLDNGYIVGSRGSVGSSLVATLSNITEVNPLPPHYVCPTCQYSEFITDNAISSGYDLPDKKCPKCGSELVGDGQNIPFETFLGFEGDKVPDIDLNFSGEFQEKAHDFTKTIFGEDKVFRAGTVGTVQRKTAYGYVMNYLESIKQADTTSPTFKNFLVNGIEGVKRTTGQHPGGIIVVPDYMDIHDFTPIQYPANNSMNSWMTTHFEYGDIHDNLLKLDILGHVDPTAMKLLEKISGIDVKTIPMNDQKVMSLFNSIDALGITDPTYPEKTGAMGLPEFGTPFVRGMLEITKPNNFSDLVRISGLSHGTDVWLNNAKDLVVDGKELSEIICCRDDIMTELIQKGLLPKDSFDIMESVRKGKGLNDKWIGIMKENSVDDWYIDSCLKIKYMFPKAHAVAYVIMAIRVAWFKVYAPQYYYVSFFTLRANTYDIETMIAGKEAISNRMYEIKALLNNRETAFKVSNKDKDLVTTLEVALEMYQRGYRFSNIDLKKSLAAEFLVDPNDDHVIIPPFACVDGLGVNVANSVIESRNELPFISKQDIIRRTSLSSTLVNKLDRLGVLKGLQEEDQLSLF